jgi:hypothetical protein
MAFLAGIFLEQVECDLPDDGEIFGCMSYPLELFVLSNKHLEVSKFIYMFAVINSVKK